MDNLNVLNKCWVIRDNKVINPTIIKKVTTKSLDNDNSKIIIKIMYVLKYQIHSFTWQYTDDMFLTKEELLKSL